MKQFHPENAGNGICETLHFNIFPGDNTPRPPYNPSSCSTPRADECPPAQKHFLTTTSMTLHSMIKHPPPPSKMMVVLPLLSGIMCILKFEYRGILIFYIMRGIYRALFSKKNKPDYANFRSARTFSMNSLAYYCL